MYDQTKYRDLKTLRSISLLIGHSLWFFVQVIICWCQRGLTQLRGGLLPKTCTKPFGPKFNPPPNTNTKSSTILILKEKCCFMKRSMFGFCIFPLIYVRDPDFRMQAISHFGKHRNAKCMSLPRYDWEGQIMKADPMNCKTDFIPVWTVSQKGTSLHFCTLKLVVYMRHHQK